MPPSIDDQILAAGQQLFQAWKKSGSVQMPENDLHPDGAGLQFRIKVLEDRVAAIEATLRGSNVGRR